MPFTNERRSPEELAEIASEIRRDIIRSLVEAKSGHSGGPLGSSDIFAVLYMGQRLTWNYAAAGVCLAGAVFFMFYFKPTA